MSESAKEKETRAQFVEDSALRLGGNHTHLLRSAMKNKSHQVTPVFNADEEIVESSPLLTSTPPTVSKALVKLYPYLIITNNILSVLTWTNDDIWPSVLMVVSYITAILYFQNILNYFGHLLLVGVLWCYSLLDRCVEESIRERPTLDDIVHIISCVNAKADLLLSPITVLTGNDIKRLLFTTVFLSPLYVIITLFILPPRRLLLIAGIYLLTYHSSWSRVTRKLLWKFKLVRLLVFYITGLDLGGINKNQGIFAAVQNKVKKISSTKGTSDDGKPIRFTYVLYENQRRWLGIGWTANMLSYERAAWTDEFLNEAPPPDQFKLPEENMGMTWRWVDRTWRLDMTNDGAIQLSSSRPRTTAQPNSDDGFIYYDNTWKKPSTEDSFSKYTRRRRWIRTAELIKNDAFDLNGVISSPPTAGVALQPIEAAGETNTTGHMNAHEESSTILENVKEMESSKRKVSFNDKKDVRIIPSTDNDTALAGAKNNYEDQVEKISQKLAEGNESTEAILAAPPSEVFEDKKSV
ncbi:LAFE_0D02410g1_1 [Lachancea fermentati]|uniref:LAFE_0D02410g1_1 n=1 Tax=Lachancea fermentati TaxID=4955 RepID=A0A1G4MB54_LACFM|nr:LAFE_0D02410g1_1 [Lachancea fermentati]